MVEVRDLVIVGAGPAGLCAAATARDLGLDVLILDLTQRHNRCRI